MTTPLPLPRFRELVACYGADSARWPAHERAAALTLLARSPDARDLLAREQRLDALLDGFDTPPLPAGLHARILRAAPQPARPVWRRFLDELGGWRLLAPGLAAALAIGVGIGAWLPATTMPPSGNHDTELDILSLARLESGEDDFDAFDPETDL